VIDQLEHSIHTSSNTNGLCPLVIDTNSSQKLAVALVTTPSNPQRKLFDDANFQDIEIEDVLFDYIEGYAKQPAPSLYQTILLYCFSMELGLRHVEHHRDLENCAKCAHIVPKRLGTNSVADVYCEACK
jgi:hypothetical protein